MGGGLYYRNDRESVRMLRQAADAGINFFDTADHYSLGGSESLVGRAFRGRREAAIISTKVGTTYSTLATAALRARPLLRPFRRALRRHKLRLHQLRAAERSCDFSARYLERAVDRSLRRLRSGYIDLLLLHKPPLAVLDQGDALRTLARLQDAGKIRYYGVSCDGADHALATLRVPGLSAIQITLNLLDQSAVAAVLPEAARLNCGVIARNPRGQGHLTSEYADVMAETYVQDIAEHDIRARAAREFGFLVREGRTLSQAAIQFVRQFDAVSVVVPRLVAARQLDEVLGIAAAPKLAPEEMARIAAVTRSYSGLLKTHPYRQVAR